MFSLEAENAAITNVSTSEWKPFSASGTSGGKAVRMEGSAWKFARAGIGPSMQWTLKTDLTGDYNVWIRMKSPDGDSIYTQLDKASLEHNFSKSSYWKWERLRSGTVSLVSGREHTFTLWGREKLLEVDKVVLVPTTGTYSPSDLGLTESSQQ